MLTSGTNEFNLTYQLQKKIQSGYPMELNISLSLSLSAIVWQSEDKAKTD